MATNPQNRPQFKSRKEHLHCRAGEINVNLGQRLFQTCPSVEARQPFGVEGGSECQRSGQWIHMHSAARAWLDFMGLGHRISSSSSSSVSSSCSSSSSSSSSQSCHSPDTSKSSCEIGRNHLGYCGKTLFRELRAGVLKIPVNPHVGQSES